MAKIKIEDRYEVSRSDKYQYKFREVNISPSEGFFDQLDYCYMEMNEDLKAKFHDDLIDLNEQILKRKYFLMKLFLTEGQYNVAKLIAQGKSQTETAKKLGLEQSSVTKMLWGNYSYSKDHSPAQYGGIKKKMTAVIIEDDTILALIEKRNKCEALDISYLDVDIPECKWAGVIKDIQKIINKSKKKKRKTNTENNLMKNMGYVGKAYLALKRNIKDGNIDI